MTPDLFRIRRGAVQGCVNHKPKLANARRRREAKRSRVFYEAADRANGCNSAKFAEESVTAKSRKMLEIALG